MALYVIADLHLSFATNKPMDIFSQRWSNHVERLEKNWLSRIEEGDVVVLPGDISWAMNLEEFLADLLFLESLPGKKLISKGNHDYWWQTSKKLRDFTIKNDIKSVQFLHNDSYIYKDKGKEYGICASRGWKCPGDNNFTERDFKIYKREVARLERSILSCSSLEKISFLHFPPFNYMKEKSDFTELIEKHGIKLCYYGHLHGDLAHRKALNGKLREDDKASYYLIAGDYLDFIPQKML